MKSVSSQNRAMHCSINQTLGKFWLYRGIQGVVSVLKNCAFLRQVGNLSIIDLTQLFVSMFFLHNQGAYSWGSCSSWSRSLYELHIRKQTMYLSTRLQTSDQFFQIPRYIYHLKQRYLPLCRLLRLNSEAKCADFLSNEHLQNVKLADIMCSMLSMKPYIHCWILFSQASCI